MKRESEGYKTYITVMAAAMKQFVRINKIVS